MQDVAVTMWPIRKISVLYFFYRRLPSGPQPGGGPVALGAPPQTPGRLRRKSELLAPSSSLLRRSRRGLVRPSGGLGAEPPVVRSCGGAASGFGAEPQESRAPLLAAALLVAQLYLISVMLSQI